MSAAGVSSDQCPDDSRVPDENARCQPGREDQRNVTVLQKS